MRKIIKIPLLVISIPIALILLLVVGVLIWFAISSTINTPKGELVLWDGEVFLQGKCYEWVDAPAGSTSKIYITKLSSYKDKETTLENMLANISGDMTIEPIKDVEIDVVGMRHLEKTDANGDFHKTIPYGGSGHIVDGEYIPDYEGELDLDFTLIIRKSGYIEVVEEVEAEGMDRFFILAILVKDND